MATAEYWIEKLELLPHPEGGFYKEVYRSTEHYDKRCLPERFRGNRSFSTSIYFLLRSDDRSLFHRIKSDELWHFYAGSSLTLYVLDNFGFTTHTLGSPENANGSFQIVIPANCWFGAKVDNENSYVLAGCTVAPGFDFDDFEMGRRDHLMELYPGQRDIVSILTPD
jgi:uncharacterized protein